MKEKGYSALPTEKNRLENIGNIAINQLEIGSEGLNLETSLRALRNRAMPKGVRDKFKKAKDLSSKDDLISVLIDTQLEFCADGFHIYTPNLKARKHYEWLQDDYNLDGIVVQMFESLCIYSNIVLHWKMKPTGDLDYVIVLDPRDIQVQPFFNNKSLVWLSVPQFIKELLNDSTSGVKSFLNGIPQKYKDAVKGTSKSFSKSNMVLLSEADNEYWLIANIGGFIDRLIDPKMEAIFDAVENRNMLIDGDFSVAFFIKNIIMHVTTGESITNGPKAGSTQNFAKESHLTKLKKEFQLTGNAMSLFTDHTTKINFIIPDTKVFDPSKFTAPEQRILRWGGIGEIILTGTGGNFAAGFINMKSLFAKVKRYRAIVKLILKRFFSHPTIIGNFAKKHVPDIFFDDELLKEAKVSLAEQQFLVDRGGISLQTVMRKSGYNPDVEEINKQEELDKLDLYLPKISSLTPISLNYGANSPKKEPGQPGRPGNEQPSHGETTLNMPQMPRYGK